MTLRIPRLAFASLLLLPAAVLPPPAHAATYTWDVAPGDGGITEGGGTWQVGTGNWFDGITDHNWSDGNEAVFGGGTAGTAGTVTLGGDVSPSILSFDLPSAGTYVIDLGSSTLTTPNTFAAITLFSNTSATIAASDGGSLATNYTGGAWNFSLTGSLTIDATVTGPGRVYTAGAGDLTVTNPANDFAGTFGKQNGGTLSFSSIADSGVASAAGAGSEVAAGFNARLAHTGDADTSTNRTLTFFGGNNGTLDNDGLGTLVWTGPFNNNTSGAAGNRNFTLGGTNTGDNEIQGVMADNGDKILNVIKNDAGTWVLSGDNSYAGTTTVSAGVLKVSHDNALGTTAGDTIVANNAKLELDGGVGDLTIAEDFTIGSGSGVIRNLAGDNTITGAVTLSNNVDLRRNAGTLTFSGGITSAANQGISFNLPTIVDTSPVDLNAGTLTITSNGNVPASGSVLKVGGNDWNLMRINFGGYLSLGAANVLPADADVEFGWHTQGSSSGTLNLNGFDQTVASIAVTSIFPDMMGNQNITGGGTLTVNQSAASREYQGRITDGATATALVKDGPGTLILNNLSGTPSSYTGTTTVAAGRLQAGSGVAFGNGSAVTVAPGAFLGLDGNSNSIGSLAGAGTVENAGPAAAALWDDDFESGSVTLEGVRMYESYIDGGWRARQTTGLGTSAWTIVGGQLENASTATGPYGGPDPYYQAEGAVVRMISNPGAGSSLTLSFDYDVAAGDILYAHFWGYTGNAGEVGSRIGNNETGNGTYGNEESEVIGAGGTSLDAYNLKDGADTGFGGTASAISGGLTGSGTYSITIDIAGLGIAGVGSLADFSHLSLAFAKDEDGTVGTTSIDNVAVTTSVVLLAAGENHTNTTFSGTIQDGTGPGVLGLSKQGTGTLTLSNANTYTGDTIVHAGTLQVGDGGTTGSLSTASSLIISRDGTLCINRSDTVTQGVDFSGGPIAGTGTFAVKGGGTVVLTNNATFNSGATVSVAAGSTVDLDYTGSTTIGTLIIDGVQAHVGTWGASGSGADHIHDAHFTGAGTLTVTTPPQRIWDGGGADGNWSTSANWVGDFAPLPPAGLVFAGSVNTATNNDFAAGSTITGIDFPNTGAGESFSLGGNNIVLGGDISTGAADGSIADSIAFDMELNGDRTITLGEGHGLTVSGVISEDASARALTKLGPGTLTLTAANTWSGNTKLFGGTTVVTHDDAFGTTPLIEMSDDDFTGTMLVLGADGLAIPNDFLIRDSGGTRTIRLDQPGTATGTLSGQVIVNEDTLGRFVVEAGTGDTLEISGDIITTEGGGAGLTKEGEGTLLLTGTNAYDGFTFVNAGTLLVNGNQTGTIGTVTVADDATFGGGGTLGGALIANAASTIAPVGTLSTGTGVNISALAGGTGTLHFDLGTLAGPNDLLASGADLDIGSGALGFSDLVFTDLGGMELGTYTLVTSTGINGTLDAGDLTGVVGEPPMKAILQINGTSLEIVTTILDTDGDGISDIYESANTIPSSPTALDPGADDDGDGVSNYAESRFGTISLAATGALSVPRLEIVSADPGGTNAAVVEFRPAIEGIEYQLTGSLDLVLFSDLDGNGIAQPGITNIASITDETSGSLTFVNDATPGVPFKSYRIEVVHNPNQP